MALSFMTGFERCRVTPNGTSDGFIAVSGTISVQNTVARNGGYAFRSSPSTSSTGYVGCATFSTSGTPTNSNITNLYLTFYFRADTLPASNNEPFVRFTASTGTYKAECRVHSDGSVSIWAGTSATPSMIEQSSAGVISTGTWYRIDIYIQNSATGNYYLKVDGSTILTGTGNFHAQNIGNFTRVYLGKINRNNQTVDFYYDDVWIDDAAQMEDGDFRITARGPISNGYYTAWTGTAADVDDIQPDFGTTTISVAAVATHSFILESCSDAGIPALSTIKGTRALAYVAESASFTSAFRVGINTDAPVSKGNTANRNTSTTFLCSSYITETDTASAAWTISSVDDHEVYVLSNSSSGTSLCTMLAMEVGYIAPAASSGSGLKYFEQSQFTGGLDMIRGGL